MNNTTIKIFDTYEYVKKLKSVGVTEQQAEVQAEALKNVIEHELTTKRDLKELEIRLIRWVTGVALAQVAVIGALLKLL